MFGFGSAASATDATVDLPEGHDGQVTLTDGRTLAYAEYGYPRGAPAFYFHGTPGGRLEGRFLDAAARARGVRLIALDRPGYGRSTFVKKRRLIDWPRDVAELADGLGIERFAVVGLSGGGPHAQACAATMPERLTATAIVSGAGSPESVLDGHGGVRRMFERFVLALAPLWAWITAMWLAFWAPRAREWMMPRSIDRQVTKRRWVRKAFIDETRDAMQQGGKAMAQDLALFSRPWRFTPKDVGRASPVLLWHGEQDRVVPARIGRYYAREIPGCRATFVPSGEHLMIIDRADEILAAVADAARGLS